MPEVKTAALIIKNADGEEFTVASGTKEDIIYFLEEAGLWSQEAEEFLQD